MRRQSFVILSLAVILFLVVFLRFYRLDVIPPGLYPDVAMNGNNALDVLKTGNFQVFYPENNGREGLFINLIALSFALFGPSVWAIKVVAAVVGVLTVLGLYLLSKEIFPQNEKIALLSSLFLTTSFWHLNFSRLGFRAVMVPFCLIFSFYFLFKGLSRLREKREICWPCPVLAGLFFGLGFHTYIAFRVVPLILGAVFIMFYFLFRQENLQRKYLVFSLCLIASLLVTFLPLAVYFWQHPADFMGRASDVSVFRQPNPPKALLVSLVSHLAMFNLRGDYNWRHNISGSPVLFWPVGLFFLVGLFLSFRKLFDLLKNKEWPEFSRWFFLLLLWGVMLLPGVLTVEAVPHSLRTIGAIPGTFLLAGLGSACLLEKLWRFAKRQSSFNFFTLVFSLVLLVTSLVLAEYGRYFNQWASNSEVRGAFSTDLVEAGQYLNSLPDNVSKYVLVNLDGVLVNGIPMPAQTPIFIERVGYGFSRAVYLKPEQLAEIKPAGRAVVILLEKDQQVVSELKSMFPSARVKELNNVLRLEI